jgi:hypothetical protein
MWVSVVWNGEMINESDVGRSGSHVIVLFTRHLPEGAEENHGNILFGWWRSYREPPTKVKFTLEQDMKAQKCLEVLLYSFFNLGARWVGWSKPRPGRITSEIDAVLIVLGSWASSRIGVDGREKSRPHRDSIPGTAQPIASRCTDWAHVNLPNTSQKP